MEDQENLPLFREFPMLGKKLSYVPLATLPTPVERLIKAGARIDLPNLYIKRDDLSGKHYGSNKVRKLEFLLGEAIQQKSKEVVTFGFAGSNHALATAIYANQLGLQCTSLLLPQVNAHYVRKNLLASHFYKSRLRSCKNLPHLFLMIFGKYLFDKIKGRKSPMLIPAGGSCPTGVIGYVNAAFELKEQVSAGDIPEPDRIYVPLGSMGTSVGLMIGLKAAGLKSQVIPVRVIEEKMASVKKMMQLAGKTGSLLCKLDPSFPAINFTKNDFIVRNNCLGPGYARFTEKAVGAADLMRKEAGIILNGTYSAKAFSAILDDADKRILQDKIVLFWNTYNSRDLSAATAGLDYRSLPKEFHRYFEEEVQQLDSAGFDR